MNFDPDGMCRILNQEGVDYIVVGGLATVILGSPLPTEDLDILPSREPANLECLARALKRMNAKIRTEGEPVEARLDADFLREMPVMLNLITGTKIPHLPVPRWAAGPGLLTRRFPYATAGSAGVSSIW